MDLASETLVHPGTDSLPEAPACSCALHEPRDEALPTGIAGEYVSFSSFSEAWLAYARYYGQHALRRFNLGPGSVVLELAGSAEGRSVSSSGVLFGHRSALLLAAQGKSADLVIARNLLTDVPDPSDIVAGFAAILKPDGILILELPYSSLSALESLLGPHGLRVFDLDALSAQGGSLRLFCCLAGSTQREETSVVRLRRAERAAGRTASHPAATPAIG